MKRIYLDYAATTPVDSAVLKAMNSFFSDKFGNPSSFHFFGQEAMAAVDASREKIAEAINAKFREIIFTGSATEANNLVLRGITNNFRKKKNFFPRIIVSAVEHGSVLEVCREIEKEGVEVVYLPVNNKGLVDLKKTEEALNDRTILVSVMYANNETGVIQPIEKISKIIKDFRQKPKIINKKTSSPLFASRALCPLFHTDAVQAFQYLNCDINKMGVDLMTLSAHKIYGPKGIGALYVKNSDFKNQNSENQNKPVFNSGACFVSPVVLGGGQEFGLRSGTENVPAIVGFSKAIELAVDLRKSESKRIKELRDYFWKQIKKDYPKAQLNGFLGNCLPGILNVYFSGKLSEDILMKLDLAGVAVSGGSACSARFSKPSHVLRSCGLGENRIKSSLRFSLGRFTVKTEIKEAIKRLKRVLTAKN